VLLVMLRQVRVVGAPVEGEVEHEHAREAELAAKAAHRLRDHAEVLGDERQRAQLPLDGVEELAAGTAPPAPLLSRRVTLRDSPVRDEPAEVVDPREVDEVERPAEALDPPAVPV